jgi:ABC-type multidrug transport system permease subunit
MGAAVLVSDLVKSQQAALFIVLLVFLVPSFFLAGLINPPSGDSLIPRLASFALPSSHFIQISRTVFLKGLGLPVLARPALILLCQGLGAIVLGLFLFKKKVG